MQPEIVPLAERVQPIEDMPMTLHPSVTAAAGRVLIVEDEWILAASAEAALEEAHCTIVGIAVTADDAVRLAEAERPDLVLMDIRLRGARNGIDAAREIRERFGIRSLFVTANSDPETRKLGGAADPAGWVQKPVSGGDLAASVLACLAHRA